MVLPSHRSDLASQRDSWQMKECPLGVDAKSTKVVSLSKMRDLAASPFRIDKLRGALITTEDDTIATEEPLEIRIHREPFSVTMRTPGNDIDLAVGFLLAEQIVRNIDDINLIEHCQSAERESLENVINVTLSSTRQAHIETHLAKKRAERATIVSASCGVCGKKTIDALRVTAPSFVKPPTYDSTLVLSLPTTLRQAQKTFAVTGGLHAAGVFDETGKLMVAREDVGRHNAVDKCIGFLVARDQVPASNLLLAVSGRTSFEIVQKALIARIQTVVSVSAPSSLAVDLARENRMGLYGFVRGGALNVYSGAVL